MPLHADMVLFHPPGKPRRAGVAEIHDSDDASRIQIRLSDLDGSLPAGIEHGEGIRAKNEVKASRGRIVGMLDQTDVLRASAGDAEHVGTEVDAGDFGIGEGGAEDIKVSPGAAADFEDASRPDEACRAMDDGITAEEKAPTR